VATALAAVRGRGRIEIDSPEPIRVENGIDQVTLSIGVGGGTGRQLISFGLTEDHVGAQPVEFRKSVTRCPRW